jgi:recombination protein RecT
MNKIAAQQNKIAANKQPQAIKDYIKAYEGEIARALPKVMTPERFTRIAMTAITQTPKLQGCTPQSFIGAMLTAAQLGLEPNTPLGQAYLIPYGNQCQFQIGYKGLMDLAHRSGELKNIEAHVVYENDEFEFEYGLEAKLRHKPAMTAKGNPTWVYAVYHLKNGGYAFEVMSFEDCMEHGKRYSKTYRNGPWQTAPEEMAKKTVLKRLLKYAPMKTEFITDDEKVLDIEQNDGEIKVISEDIIEADYAEIDEETGEITE